MEPLTYAKSLSGSDVEISDRGETSAAAPVIHYGNVFSVR